MIHPLINLNSLIKREADKLLYEKGLFNIFHDFGTPHIHGSYALNLMTWRDLDIYIQTDNISATDFFVLGSKICSALSPIKMSFAMKELEKQKVCLSVSIGAFIWEMRY